MVWDLARCLFPVTRKRPAMKRHLGRRISDLLLPTRAAGGGGVMVGGGAGCSVGRAGGREGERETGVSRWPPKVENPGPPSPCLFCSTFLEQLRGSHLNSVLQLLKALTGNKSATQHCSFLKPGGSSFSNFKLVAGRARPRPRKATVELLKDDVEEVSQ